MKKIKKIIIILLNDKLLIPSYKVIRIFLNLFYDLLKFIKLIVVIENGMKNNMNFIYLFFKRIF